MVVGKKGKFMIVRLVWRIYVESVMRGFTLMMKILEFVDIVENWLWSNFWFKMNFYQN